MKKGWKIFWAVFVLLVAIGVLGNFLPKTPEKREAVREEKSDEAKVEEVKGVDISAKSKEYRINDALDTANAFLKAIQNDEFEESYKYLCPLVTKVISVSHYTSSIRKCGKDAFPLEVQREHFVRQNFDDWKGTSFDSVVFKIPKEFVPEEYCSIYVGGRSGVTIWLEDKNHKYYIGYEIHVMCDRIENTLRSEWGIDSVGAWIDINFQDRAVLRGIRRIVRTKGK